MLILRGRLCNSILQHRADATDALTSGRPRAGKDDAAHQVRAFLRNDLRDEAAQRVSQEINLGKFEGVNEGHSVFGHIGDIVRSLTP